MLTYKFCLSLWKIARCSVILLLPYLLPFIQKTVCAGANLSLWSHYTYNKIPIEDYVDLYCIFACLWWYAAVLFGFTRHLLLFICKEYFQHLWASCYEMGWTIMSINNLNPTCIPRIMYFKSKKEYYLCYHIGWRFTWLGPTKLFSASLRDVV